MAVGPFYESNLAELKKLNSAQADMIAELTPKVEQRLYPILPLDNGYANIVLPSQEGIKYQLFNTPKPGEEIAAWLKSTDLGANREHAVILLGFDLGFYPHAILERLPPNRVLALVEPDPLLFFTAFHHRNLSKLFGDARVHFYVGQTVEKAVESVGSELQWSRFLSLPYALLVTPLLRRIRADYPRRFAETWRNALQRELMYRRSRIEHRTQVVVNTVANAEAIARYPGLATLFHQFYKIPAALIAAGPSLEKNLPLLQKAQNRLLLACVNTAYPVLRKNGIRPHLVFTMDHQERNALSFREDISSPETYLIADPRITPAVIRHFHPRVFLASWRTTTETVGEPVPVDQIPSPKMSGNAVYLWLQSLVGSKGDVFGPGSVAVVGFHILARLGCRPIILMGQDLAFTDDKRYATGTIFDNPNLPRDAEADHWVPSIDGGLLPTSETLFLYRRLLEHEIARFGISVFNTSSGAVISGTVTSRLENILKEIPDRIPDIHALIRSLHETYSPRMDRIDLQRALRRAIAQLSAFAEEAKKALGALPPDPTLTLTREDKRRMLARLEEAIQLCSSRHEPALELLNELLQESHFKYEDCRWRSLAQTDESAALDDKLLTLAMVLDEFVKQAVFLATLFEEEIAELDR